MRTLFLQFCFIFLWNTGFSQIATGKGKWLGNIINTSTPANFSTYWNQVTPENAGKWGSVEKNQDVMPWLKKYVALTTAIPPLRYPDHHVKILTNPVAYHL